MASESADAGRKWLANRNAIHCGSWRAMDWLASDHVQWSRVIQRVSDGIHTLPMSPSPAGNPGPGPDRSLRRHGVCPRFPPAASPHTLAAKTNDLACIAPAASIHNLAAVSDPAQRAGTSHTLPSRIEHTSASAPCISPAQIAVESIHQRGRYLSDPASPVPAEGRLAGDRRSRARFQPTEC